MSLFPHHCLYLHLRGIPGPIPLDLVGMFELGYLKTHISHGVKEER